MIEENNDNWNTGKLEHPYGRGINLSMTVSNIEKMYEILKEKNISLMSDTSKLEEIIKIVLKENETSVNDYKSGKQNALKFLMGMIMKETKGSANPKIVNDMLIDLLSKDVN